MTQVPDLGDWLQVAPWRTRAVSLMHINGTDLYQEHTLDGKRALMERSGGFLIALWTGKYRTDARHVPPEDRPELAAILA